MVQWAVKGATSFLPTTDALDVSFALRRIVDDDGYLFYYHAATEMTQWEKPVDF